MSDQPSISDQLAIITRVIEWHQTIRDHVKLVGDSVTDQEALSSLQRARADWVPGRLDILAEKQKKFQQAISLLEEGLRNHFTYEEEVLPPLLGELFMRALLMEHREIKRKINEAETVVANVKLDGLSREECLAKESDIQQVIGSLCQAIGEHATREETMLEMLQRALQDKDG